LGRRKRYANDARRGEVGLRCSSREADCNAVPALALGPDMGREADRAAATPPSGSQASPREGGGRSPDPLLGSVDCPAHRSGRAPRAAAWSAPTTRAACNPGDARHLSVCNRAMSPNADAHPRRAPRGTRGKPKPWTISSGRPHPATPPPRHRG
jgi:hypothetical protein